MGDIAERPDLLPAVEVVPDKGKDAEGDGS